MTAATTALLGRVVGIFSDVHGAQGPLAQALAECRAAGVETIALLGDLFDRAEQADPCARALAGWAIVGVWGNHEREMVLDAASHGIVDAATVRLLSGLGETVFIEDICLTHEAAHWGGHDLHARLFGHARPHAVHGSARITFAGHTHYRAARDQHGPLDLSRGSVRLDPVRRYLINPGALAVGQFAIWDRDTSIVQFRHV